ncbi:MAG: superoxide dismutase family protein [Planctomycetota bacterium]|nr:superoxide dismutase family protein [Planctomycetota bacterium]
MRSTLHIAAVFGYIAVGLAAGCQQSRPSSSAAVSIDGNTVVLAADAPAKSPLREITAAIAIVQPLSDSKVAGKVTFTQSADGVMVVADITGLTPGKHGFHIHQFGDLSDPKGASAGGHYNPEGEAHGLPGSPHHHPGDMGNLEADADGKAHLEITLAGATLAGDKDPILGRSIIIHAKEDDGGQPTGNAGGRIGGGIIGVAKVK